MGAERNRDEAGMYLGPFQMARDQTLLAAIEAGVSAVDAVFTDFRDEAGLMREARAAKALGFTGKMAIHPAQVPVIHAAFRPEPAEVDWARAVIAALDVTGEGVRSEEHTSELQSLMRISYAVFCLKKKNTKDT